MLLLLPDLVFLESSEASHLLRRKRPLCEHELQSSSWPLWSLFRLLHTVSPTLAPSLLLQQEERQERSPSVLLHLLFPLSAQLFPCVSTWHVPAASPPPGLSSRLRLLSETDPGHSSEMTAPPASTSVPLCILLPRSVSSTVFTTI